MLSDTIENYKNWLQREKVLCASQELKDTFVYETAFVLRRAACSYSIHPFSTDEGIPLYRILHRGVSYKVKVFTGEKYSYSVWSTDAPIFGIKEPTQYLSFLTITEGWFASPIYEGPLVLHACSNEEAEKEVLKYAINIIKKETLKLEEYYN